MTKSGFHPARSLSPGPRTHGARYSTVSEQKPCPCRKARRSKRRLGRAIASSSRDEYRVKGDRPCPDEEDGTTTRNPVACIRVSYGYWPGLRVPEVTTTQTTRSVTQSIRARTAVDISRP